MIRLFAALLDPVYTVPDEFRPFSPVYTRIRPVRGSQIRPVLWFSCCYTGNGRISDRCQIRPVPFKRGLMLLPDELFDKLSLTFLYSSSSRR